MDLPPSSQLSSDSFCLSHDAMVETDYEKNAHLTGWNEWRIGSFYWNMQQYKIITIIKHTQCTPFALHTLWDCDFSLIVIHAVDAAVAADSVESVRFSNKDVSFSFIILSYTFCVEKCAFFSRHWQSLTHYTLFYVCRMKFIIYRPHCIVLIYTLFGLKWRFNAFGRHFFFLLLFFSLARLNFTLDILFIPFLLAEAQ